MMDIPLAKKLKDCGVFGVSSDEYLQYAMNNRAEWEQKGESIVEELVMSVKKSKTNSAPPQDSEALKVLKEQIKMLA